MMTKQQAEQEAFKRANSAVHPVESQWHYPIMVKHGFVPMTMSAVGFVRSYEYRNDSGRKIRCVTGASADYWEGPDGAFGYWADLELYLQEKARIQ